MAALTTARSTNEVLGGGRTLELPVKAKAVIHQGALVAIDANGYAIPAKKAAGLRAAGRAEQTVDNTSGADGGVTVRVTRGVYLWDNSATAGGKLTAAHLLGPCYMEDDHTVSAAADGSSVAGLVTAVSGEGVAVEICPALAYPAATTPAQG